MSSFKSEASFMHEKDKYVKTKVGSSPLHYGRDAYPLSKDKLVFFCIIATVIWDDRSICDTNYVLKIM